MTQIILESFATYNNQGSGWIFSQVLELSLKTDDLTILNGSNYIELPKTLSSKKAIINEQNEDNECFKCAVLSAIHYDDIDKNHQRVSKYKNHQDELNFKAVAPAKGGKGGRCPLMLKKMALVILPNLIRKLGGGYPSQM